MKRMGARALSWLLTFALLLGLCPAAVFAADIPDALVTSLAQLYDGDEVRAREELEALYEAGIIDENGNMVALDVREDGESVELDALALRVANGETVGAITVNGHAATAEQIVQISRVGDLLELVRALDGDVEITDEHVANLEALLAGIADGSIDLSSAIERGSLTLASSGDAASTVVREGTVDATDGKYTQPMLDGSEYDAAYQFDLLDANNTAYYVDSRYNGVALDGTVTLTCDKTTVNPGGTVTVTAALNKAQPLPVSFNWNASGAVLGDTVSGTVTWAAGETGDKTFTVTVPAKAADDLWNGGRAFVINAGNLKNAVCKTIRCRWVRRRAGVSQRRLPLQTAHRPPSSCAPPRCRWCWTPTAAPVRRPRPR